MTDFSYTAKVRGSRRQAAERLVDLAYTLTAGSPLELSVDGEKALVSVPERLELDLDVELSWSSASDAT